MELWQAASRLGVGEDHEPVIPGTRSLKLRSDEDGGIRTGRGEKVTAPTRWVGEDPSIRQRFARAREKRRQRREAGED